jgi:hypothetical protein
MKFVKQVFRNIELAKVWNLEPAKLRSREHAKIWNLKPAKLRSANLRRPEVMNLRSSEVVNV